MTHDEMIAVIEAAKAGKRIQFRSSSKESTYPWTDIDDPTWDFSRFIYRAKPEPRVIYVPEHVSGNLDMARYSLSKLEAQFFASTNRQSLGYTGRIVTLVEQLD